MGTKTVWVHSCWMWVRRRYQRRGGYTRRGLCAISRGSGGCLALLRRGENQRARQRGLTATFQFWRKLQEVKAPVVGHVPPERIQRIDEGGNNPDKIRTTSVRKGCTRRGRESDTYQRRKSMCPLFHPSLADSPFWAIRSDTTIRCAADKKMTGNELAYFTAFQSGRRLSFDGLVYSTIHCRKRTRYGRLGYIEWHNPAVVRRRTNRTS